MFVDKVQVKVVAGRGGNGIVSFRHEKFINKGGPNGGDGGDGGDVIAVASRNQNTLATFRFNKLLKASPGGDGQKQNKHGKNGKDIRVKVPVGTVITDVSGALLVDLVGDKQEAVIARGGKGGFGNAHFVSSTRQAPKIAEKGEDGEELDLIFELKSIADVGLVGLPNAGKSTLLSRISRARPEIADYPFTTLRPNLGVADIDQSNSLLFADIPGLIEGASKGRGLGDEFLRHVERTRVLIHLVDVYDDDIKKSYNIVQNELALYPVDLSKKPKIIALNKVEGLDQKLIKGYINSLKMLAPKKTKVFAISANSGFGIKELLFEAQKLSEEKAEESRDTTEAIPIIRLDDDDAGWKVAKNKKTFVVTGKKIERFAKRTDFDNPEGIKRLRNIMGKMGINHHLLRSGIKPGNKIKIGDPSIAELEY